jgi:hypothetical protein
LVEPIIAFPSANVNSGEHVALQAVIANLISREQCSPVSPGARVNVVVQAIPPNPIFQSTEVSQVEDELLVILTAVRLLGEDSNSV